MVTDRLLMRYKNKFLKNYKFLELCTLLSQSFFKPDYMVRGIPTGKVRLQTFQTTLVRYIFYVKVARVVFDTFFSNLL